MPEAPDALPQFHYPSGSRCSSQWPASAWCRHCYPVFVREALGGPEFAVALSFSGLAVSQVLAAPFVGRLGDPVRRQAVHRGRFRAVRDQRRWLPDRGGLGAGRRVPRAVGVRGGRDLPAQPRLHRTARARGPRGQLHRCVRRRRGDGLRARAAARRGDSRCDRRRRRIRDDGRNAGHHWPRDVAVPATGAPRLGGGNCRGDGGAGSACSALAGAAAAARRAGGSDREHRDLPRLGHRRDLHGCVRDQRRRGSGPTRRCSSACCSGCDRCSARCSSRSRDSRPTG